MILLVLIIIFFILLFIYIYSKDNLTFSQSIPKKIIQTYKNRDKVPNKVFENINKFAPDYEYTFFSDEECFDFIEKYYDNTVLQAYNNLKNKAHKADLFRYCYLYIHGGVYLDIKTELLKPLNEIFLNSYLYTCLSIIEGTLYQGLISTAPKNKIFLDLIDFIKKSSKQEELRYHTFTTDFYERIKKDIQTKLKHGLNKGKNTNYYLLQEKCTSNVKDCYDGLDNKGLCCYIYDNNKKIIKTRYSDYPW